MTAEELKQWRLSMNMTQRVFSFWIKPERTTDIISQWELGKKPVPEWLDTLKELHELKNVRCE